MGIWGIPPGASLAVTKLPLISSARVMPMVSISAFGYLYRVLAAYRPMLLPVNARNYAVLAQGLLQEIRKIQALIDTYKASCSAVDLPPNVSWKT